MTRAFGIDDLTIDGPDKTHYLATWRHQRDGKFADLWHTATGGRAVASGFLNSTAAIKGDQRLSDSAKREDSKAKTLEALRDLGDRQRGLNSKLAALHDERSKLAAVPGYNGDAALATVDIAIASHLRSLTGTERERAIADLAPGGDQRMVEAVLRLPRALTGLSPETHAVVTSRAIERANPEAVQEMQELDEAAQAAQRVLSKAFHLITDGADLEIKDLLVNLGDGAWQQHVKAGNPEAVEALARRYAAEPEEG